MTERLVNQPLTRVTVFQCPSCSRTVRNDLTATPYRCPWGCANQMIVLRTEWEERGTHAAPDAAKEHRDDGSQIRGSR
jgi:predicted RNA-binding Zn-ribbon protein involved in translation (DUF1610 family)